MWEVVGVFAETLFTEFFISGSNHTLAGYLAPFFAFFEIAALVNGGTFLADWAVLESIYYITASMEGWFRSWDKTFISFTELWSSALMASFILTSRYLAFFSSCEILLWSFTTCFAAVISEITIVAGL